MKNEILTKKEFAELQEKLRNSKFWRKPKNPEWSMHPEGKIALVELARSLNIRSATLMAAFRAKRILKETANKIDKIT